MTKNLWEWRIAKLNRLFKVVRNGPRTLLDHLHVSSSDYTCNLRDGCRFEIRGGRDDCHVLFEVFVEQIYPMPVSAGDVVIDIGAHIGCYTVWAARRGARVFAFEPHPDNFTQLQRNVALNDVTTVVLTAAAVSGKRETRPMVLPDDPAHTGRYSLYPGRGSQVLQVPCISLDDVVEQHQLTRVDVLKIDCQGSEYEILYGARPETLAKVRNLAVECEVFQEPPEWSLARLERFLADQGFRTRSLGNLLYAARDKECLGTPSPAASGSFAL